MVAKLKFLYKYYRLNSTEREYVDQKIAVQRLRNELMLWGYDTSDMTDEELTEAVTEMGRKLALTGISTAEANKNLKQFRKKLAEIS